MYLMVSGVMEKNNAGNVTRRTEGRQTQVREDLAEKVTFVQSPEGGEGGLGMQVPGKEHFRERRKCKGLVATSFLTCLKTARGPVWCGRKCESVCVGGLLYSECSAGMGVGGTQDGHRRALTRRGA